MNIRSYVLLLYFAWSASAQIVALDGFHNDETKMPDHYRWEGTSQGGYSELGKVIKSLGGELRTVHERLTPKVLSPIKIFIIPDPDTPAESDNPKYLEPSEVDALDQWVRAGGRLVLLGNDKGNAEFEHFNQLATRFGIQFLEETFPKVKGKGILVAQGTGSIFGDGATIYLVEIAPLKVTGSAQVLLEDHGTPVMALARAGKGLVFALGDPWVYNEYIDRNDNRKVAENLFRMLLAGGQQ
jgi:unsaturated rhamnogalacturonyl hydrolase